jgi:hypothetical protein
MSIISIRWAYSQPIKNIVQKSVLVFLCTHDFPGNLCTFSIQTICNAISCKEDAARNALKKLHEKKYIQKEARYSEDGRQLTNGIRVLIPVEYVQKCFNEYELNTKKEGGRVDITPLPPPDINPPSPPDENDPKYNNIKYNNKKIILAASVDKLNEDEKATPPPICASDDARDSHFDDILFSKFWDAYPKKTGKKYAMKVWKKNRLYKNADNIIADIYNRREKNWKGKSKQYLPDPSTYLNGERWEDELFGEESAQGELKNTQKFYVPPQVYQKETNRELAKEKLAMIMKNLRTFPS